MENYENMLDIGGVVYRIDLSAMDDILAFNNKDKEYLETETTEIYDNNKKLISREVKTKKSPKSKEIDGPKYEILRTFLDVVLSYNEEMDDALGYDRAMSDTPLPFKLAFNSLLAMEILKEIK